MIYKKKKKRGNRVKDQLRFYNGGAPSAREGLSNQGGERHEQSSIKKACNNMWGRRDRGRLAAGEETATCNKQPRRN